MPSGCFAHYFLDVKGYEEYGGHKHLETSMKTRTMTAFAHFRRGTVFQLVSFQYQNVWISEETTLTQLQ